MIAFSFVTLNQYAILTIAQRRYFKKIENIIFWHLIKEMDLFITNLPFGSIDANHQYIPLRKLYCLYGILNGSIESRSCSSSNQCCSNKCIIVVVVVAEVVVLVGVLVTEVILGSKKYIMEIVHQISLIMSI